jgi:hypothetical protein
MTTISASRSPLPAAPAPLASAAPARAGSPAESRAGLSLPAATVALTLFTAFSVWVCIQEGPLGFIGLVRRELWGLQLLLDLVIAAYLSLTWMVRDARQRRIAPWPYVLATTLVGSIGLLSYLVHRGVVARRRGAAAG